MTTVEEIAKADEKKINDFIESHPEYADDVELEIIKDIEEHIEFIVPQTDDPSTPAWTFRSVFIGVCFCIVLSFANTCLSFRSAPFAIPAVAATIISYPIGIFFAKVLPSGFFNPGPFSMKEHVLIFIMAACSGQPYGIDNIVVQMHPTLMANTDITYLQAFSFVLVTQFLGYGFAGLTRRFLVRPTAMWWPGNITTIAIFSSFHNANTGEIANEKYTWTRSKFFWVAFIGLFVYQWIPQMFAPALQAIAIACVFSGRGSGKPGVMTEFNAIAASVTNGSGLFGLTFDWTNIGSLNFAQPLYANLMNALGNITFLWIATPLLYSTDMFGLNKIFRLDYYSYSDLNPITNTPVLFVGNPNSTKALGSRVSPRYFYDKTQNYNINITAYNNVAPIHLSSNFALCYASSFLTAMNAFKQARDEVDSLDKHVKMMEAYPDIPDWFFLIFMLVCIAGALLVSIFTPFGMPWWGIFFNVFLVSLFVIPYGSIQAITGVGMYLNVVSQFVIGLTIPGQTVAVMAFKSWGTNNLIQAFSLSSDLKLGQYLHIPPYALVGAQFIGTFINAVVATAAAWYMMFSTGDLLGSTGWGFNLYQVFYNAGGIWGAIGPQRFFGIGSIYENLLWCFLIGAACPLLPFFANKYVVKSKYWSMINFAIFFQFAGPQTAQVYIVMPVLCNVFAQVYLFNKNKEFFQKYLYVMGAAFDAAAGIVSLIISMLAVGGIGYTSYWALSPNTDNVPLDYYCYPGADYEDWNCEYYLNLGENVTATGKSCV
ncbi:OPT oligopeptide transporter protein-domain-containing protein [Obelidium mucronatum]|nr:OPT oligopeptide transporter protein-domain-containing protein [Obelidium mucronatum]